LEIDWKTFGAREDFLRLRRDDGGMFETTSPMALLAAAIALLPTSHQPTVPVVPVEAGRASQVLVEMARGSCAFVQEPDRLVIFVNLDCPHARLAKRGDLVGLIALAATIAHEQAHVTGADEPRARLIEEGVFRQLALRLPPDRQVQALSHLQLLRQRPRDGGQVR
jgi:hypothetical protein